MQCLSWAVAASVLVSMTTGAASAATGSGTAAATVVAPVSIVNDAPIAFGTFTPAAGTIVTSPDGNRSASGGAATLSSAVPASAGQLTVSGAAQATYAISASGGVLTGTGDPMTLSNITLAAATATGTPIASGTIGAGGTHVIRTGGQLAVAPNQRPGAYSGSYTVTVEYN